MLFTICFIKMSSVNWIVTVLAMRRAGQSLWIITQTIWLGVHVNAFCGTVCSITFSLSPPPFFRSPASYFLLCLFRFSFETQIDLVSTTLGNEFLIITTLGISLSSFLLCTPAHCLSLHNPLCPLQSPCYLVCLLSNFHLTEFAPKGNTLGLSSVILLLRCVALELFSHPVGL